VTPIMLCPKAESPRDDVWQNFLEERPFGQLIAGHGPDIAIVPTHYRFDRETHSIEGHLDRRNPVFERLAVDRGAWLSVADDFAFIPGFWNARDEASSHLGPPTSY
jgi:transcriptional regulator